MSVAVADTQTLRDAVREIATDVAAVHADDVDRRGRFPSETIDALREAGALGAFVPSALGGGGVSLRVARGVLLGARRRLRVERDGVRHAPDPGRLAGPASGPRIFFEGYLGELAANGRLIASVTSEIGTGGDMGRSIAAITPAGDGLVDVREAGADGQLRRLRGRPAHDRSPLARGRARRPGRRDHPPGAERSSSRPGHGTCSACGAPARPGSPSAPISPPSRSWRRRSPGSPPSRWSRSRTSCGRTCGWASPRTRSAARGRSSARRPSASRAGRCPPPSGSRT